MMYMFDTSGNRVLEWKLGKKFALPKNIDAVDINAICASELELEFLTSVVAGLIYPKNAGTVWWYAATAKTVSSIMDGYTALEQDSKAFLGKRQKLDDVKKRVSSVVTKIKSFDIGDTFT
jgi:hypothetical protein